MMIKIIAEIGCNHMGDMSKAEAMIVAAAAAGADVVKFQKRTVRECLSEAQYNALHPNTSNAFHEVYGKHREALEFDLTQHCRLKQVCESQGVMYSTSTWDNTAAQEIISLNPAMIKVPSASNECWEMLETLRDTYTGEVHISLGMTLKEQRRKIVDLFGSHAKDRLILYACTSGYPNPAHRAHLLDISELIDNFGDDVKAIGFSGHHEGIVEDIAAVALGAQYVERHYTICRDWKGTDQQCSLDTAGLTQLTTALRRTAVALTSRPDMILDVEQGSAARFKFGGAQ